MSSILAAINSNRDPNAIGMTVTGDNLIAFGVAVVYLIIMVKIIAMFDTWKR